MTRCCGAFSTGRHMSTLERAIQIAAEAHSAQTDKAGQPYILHPLRVMLSLSGNSERIVAVLHDVIEDTAVSLEHLAAAGFSSSELEALEALTKRPNEDRLSAARRAAKNEIARLVKLADNADNMEIGRISDPTEKDFARIEEYKAVRAVLLAPGESSRD